MIHEDHFFVKQLESDNALLVLDLVYFFLCFFLSVVFVLCI